MSGAGVKRRGGRTNPTPTVTRDEQDRYCFGVAGDTAPDLDGVEVVRVIDDGMYWFELRGVSVRGMATPHAARAETEAAGLTWYASEHLDPANRSGP